MGRFIGWLFLGIGLFFFLAGEALAICIIMSGRFLARRIRYWFSFVIACIECVVFPVGTVLGIFTIVVLLRDSVKNSYGLSSDGNPA